MNDIFENPILCKNCKKQMNKATLVKNNFSMRALKCLHCNNFIIHPTDEAEYKHFLNLRKKDFNVKLRLVGNSYTVSIPREIVNFINEQDKIIDEIVKLNFEGMRKLSLVFDQGKNDRKIN
jgi:hypothetical protein